MTRLVVKVNPYNPPFRPASQPGVYWIDREFVGDRLHDAHVMDSRVVLFRRPVQGSSSTHPAYLTYMAGVAHQVDASRILSESGLDHLANESGCTQYFVPTDEFLADMSSDGIKAARRVLRRRAVKGGCK